MQLTSGVRAALAVPRVYNFFQNLVGASRFRDSYVKSYVQAKPGDKILDIGCGTSEILEFLPDAIAYIGYDLSPDYISAAKSRYGTRGQWYCAEVSKMPMAELGSFDIVMANGVLHHLDDKDASKLAEIAAKSLKVSGRFCTFDGCFLKDQNSLARYLIANDRGQNVRTPEGYVALIQPYFSTVELTIRHDMLRIPYSHAITVATQRTRT